MKKFLMFAFALVASALAFTSCEGGANSPLVGTWSYQTEPAQDSGWYGVYTVIFKANGGFVFTDEAHAPDQPQAHDKMLMEGKYEIKGDIATVHYLKHGWDHDGQIEYIPDWEGFDEQMKFLVEGQTLTLWRNYQEGAENAYKEVYTKQ